VPDADALGCATGDTDGDGTAPSTTAPSTNAPTTTAPATTAPSTRPETRGPARDIKGFREVDEAKLRAQLPPQAAHLAKAFIDSGRRHNVDPVALAAISKHETGNFTSSAFRNKNNAMGISNDRGPTHQRSHEASIDHMARLLGSTTGGPYKNASTIGEVANIYAPIGARNDPGGLNNHWARGSPARCARRRRRPRRRRRRPQGTRRRRRRRRRRLRRPRRPPQRTARRPSIGSPMPVVVSRWSRARSR